MSQYIFRFWSWVVFTFVWAVALIALHLFPSSYWMDVRKVHISDAKVGTSPEMVVDRTISHPFTATWSANVRTWENGGWAIFCQAQGGGDYKVDAKFPLRLDLNWWTGGKCANLPSGKYMVTTVWTWNPPGIIPNQQKGPIDSNVFEIR